MGWGGNNGTTLTAGILANKLNMTWKTRTGLKKANYFGSLTQSVTTKIGLKIDEDKKTVKDVFKIIKDIVPLVNPNDIEITGWDIQDLNLYEAAQNS